MKFSPTVRFAALLLASGISARSLAQPATSAAANDAPASTNPVTLTQTVEPSFHIEPIVHRFQGRRGEVIPFSFLVESTGKAMDVVVSPVNLRQEESGIILHDENSEVSSQIRFSSPASFKLAPGESQQISGEVTVPLSKTNYLSYGILVKDLGQLSDKSSTPDAGSQTTASVRFVTQYVLRIDLETGVQDFTEMKQLVLEQGHVHTVKGMPVARAYLVNPTDYALECHVNGTVKSSAAGRSKAFRMMLPSRKDLLGDERYLVRVMPRSRVRLEAEIESLLFSGPQAFNVSLTNGRRSIVEENFELMVQPGDFPAMETQLAFLQNDLSVQPAQIELGRIPGSSRMCNLRFSNNSDQSLSLQLKARDLDGGTLQGLSFSSDRFEVKPGHSKTIRATIESSEGQSQAVFGQIEVQTESAAATVVSSSLPVALLYGPAAAPNVQVGELQSIETQGLTAFQLEVTNRGDGFVPVHGTLQVADGKGRILELSDGYGRWLAAGETRVLKFKPEHRIPAGEYQLSLSVQTQANQQPFTKTLAVKIAPGEAPPAVTATTSKILSNPG